MSLSLCGTTFRCAISGRAGHISKFRHLGSLVGPMIVEFDDFNGIVG